MQKGRFPSKIALHLKKICRWQYSQKTLQQCKALIGLSILSVQKCFAANVPYYVKIWLKLTN